MQNPRSILITGASNGIGRALAMAYARRDVTLFLAGLAQDRLDAITAICRDRGAFVHSKIIDVRDADAMAAWIAEADATTALDLVIANAGISLGYKPDQDLGSHTAETFAVNVDGVFHTIHPVISLMRKRRSGQIAIMSSLAGFGGLPSSPAYSTSKVTVKAYGEALRGVLRPQGIEVSVICPGFVESHMTARNTFPMPFLMTADKAAGIIISGLAKNKARIAFPFPMLAGIRLLHLLPASWLDRLLSVAPRK